MAYTSPPPPVTLALDGHLHVYPNHDPDRLFDACLTALQAAGGPSPTVQPAALLTEGANHHVFREARRTLTFPGRCSVEAGPDSDTLLIRHPDHDLPLLVFAGRQIVTAERLEILALTHDVDIADGRPITETLQAVTRAGAVACLAWAPGKWWGNRQRLVEACLAKPHGLFCVGDTALRPWGWPEPALMRAAARRGIPILAGSDPLPIPGDERRAGQYGCRVTLDAYDAGQPADSLRAALARGSHIVDRIGRRCAPLGWFRNQLMHRIAGRTRP